MATIEKLNTTINLTASTNEFSVSEIVKNMCSHTDGMEYIGERVTTKRIKFIFVKYRGKIYYVGRCFFKGYKFSCDLKVFRGKFKNTEPIIKYEYYLEYHNPIIDSEKSLCLYYKSNELAEAKKIQEVVGEDLARICKI